MSRYWTNQQRGRVLGTKWLLKIMRKLYVGLSFDSIFLGKLEVLGNDKWNCADKSDIHKTMNVSKVSVNPEKNILICCVSYS